MKVIKFSNRHSRNAHDFDYEKDPITGRHVLVANHRGVKSRIGLLITALSKCPLGGMTSEEQVTYLQTKFDPSYTNNDLSQPHRLMLKHKLVVKRGKGRGTRYFLTPKGKELWDKSIKKEWIG